MKIALLTDGIFPFVIGGMQKHSYYLAKYLSRHQINVRVYHCLKEASNYHHILHDIFTKEEREYLEFVDIPFDFSSHFPGFYLYESYLYSKRIYQHLQKDIHTFNFIYAKGFTSWYLLIHRPLYSPPIGIKLHGYEMYQYAPNIYTKLQHYWLRIPTRFITKNADVVFSYGGNITNIIQTHLGISSNKIIEIPTGIEQNKISPDISEYHSVRKFIFVGRYEKRKGIDNLNKAIEHLIQNKQIFEFYFIGNIPEKFKIKHDHVKYYGMLSQEDEIRKILKQCDVLVCPSYSEGMPNVIIEAMASGLTIIATDVGAVRELVNEQTGYLLKNNTVESLIEILNKLIQENDTNLQQKKEAALKHIQNFSWEKISTRLIAEIKKYALPH